MSMTSAGKRCSSRSSPDSPRSEEHTSELQSRSDLVCRLLLEKKKAPELLDLVDQLLCALLDLVGERLDHVRAGERVDCVGRARLVGQDLLGAEGDPGGALRGH